MTQTTRLSARDRVHFWLLTWFDANEEAPTHARMVQALSMNRTAIARALRELRAEGRVEFDSGFPRTLRLAGVIRPPDPLLVLVKPPCRLTVRYDEGWLMYHTKATVKRLSFNELRKAGYSIEGIVRCYRAMGFREWT